MADPSATHLDVLKKHFGHSQFKPMQWKIIHSILHAKKDNCAVMATGYGKSLCYQYPAVFGKGSTVVISPLISLMEDQVLNLKMNNIPACYLGSAQMEKSKTWDSIESGEMRVIYMTPEFVTGDPACLSQIPNVILIAIDEAHCVSEWGHDFRPSYRNLSVLREHMPCVPILAVTATATPNVIQDICTNLKLRDPNIINTGFDRPNLYLAASIKQDNIMADLRKLLGADAQFPGSTIVYCPTKAICDKLCEVLSLNNIKNRPYHSNISIKHRKEIHELFVSDQIKVVVATCAFGMGIDKPDVRCIVHYGAPKDLSAYYQEIGRAGRDGLDSTCYTFFNSSDFNKNSLLFASNSNNAEIQKHCSMMMKRVEQYLELRTCRRKYLLEHFSDPYLGNSTGTTIKRCCDNCDGNNSSTSLISCDLDEQVANFLKVIVLMRGSYGLGAYIKFIRGTGDSRITEKMKINTLYGSGKNQSEPWWKALSRLCVRENLVAEKKIGANSGGGWKVKAGQPWGNISVYEVSTLGNFYLQRGKTSGIVLTPSAEMLQLEKVPREKRVVENTGAWMNTSGKPSLQPLPHLKKEDILVKRLQDLRTELAQEEACLRYMIITEKQLEEIAHTKARTREDLVAAGITEFKIEKYGRRFLEVIYEVCEFNEPVPDLSVSEVKDVDSGSISEAKDVNTEIVPEAKIADTSVAETRVADTSVAETRVADTSVAETRVADTSAAVVENWEDEAFFGDIDYEQLDQSINQEDKEVKENPETHLNEDLAQNEDDTFFENIDYDQLDQTINLKENESRLSETNLKEVQAKEKISTNSSVESKLSSFKFESKVQAKEKISTGNSIESKLSSFKFESKNVNSEASLSSSCNKSRSLNSNQSSSQTKENCSETCLENSGNPNEADWEDDCLFREMDYNQVEQCMKEEKLVTTEEKLSENRTNEAFDLNSLECSAKKIKLDKCENHQSNSLSGTKASSLLKFETSKTNSEASNATSSVSSFSLKSKPKSKLSKFI